MRHLAAAGSASALGLKAKPTASAAPAEAVGSMATDLRSQGPPHPYGLSGPSSSSSMTPQMMRPSAIAPMIQPVVPRKSLAESASAPARSTAGELAMLSGAAD